MSRIFITEILLNEARDNGGFTFNYLTDEFINSGYAVPIAGHEVKTQLKDFNVQTIQSYLDWFGQQKMFTINVSIGCWWNPKDQHFYLDTVEIVKSKSQAIRKGMLADQKSIFNLDTQETIWLPERQKIGTETQKEMYLVSKVLELSS